MSVQRRLVKRTWYAQCCGQKHGERHGSHPVTSPHAHPFLAASNKGALFGAKRRFLFWASQTSQNSI
eukprot:2881017-Prymnesium_polylepis.2